MPTCTAGSPFRNDFTNPADFPVSRTRKVRAILREARKVSLEGDFNGKPNLSLNLQARDVQGEQFFLWRTLYFIR